MPIHELRAYAGREFRRLIRPLYYDDIRRRSSLPGGAYLFSDIEILDPKPLERIRRVAARMREHGATILNDPSRALGRYALLRRLANEGINDFDVYRVDEHRTPSRWPVFLRGERDHEGRQPDLLRGEEELAARLGRDPSENLIVEHVDVRDDDGLYRKFGACRVADRVFARHLFFDDRWMVKMHEEHPEERRAEERAFVSEFPDRQEVERIFVLAGIEYGRIDYGRKDGRIQVWEINTNPVIIHEATREHRNRWALNVEVIAQVVEGLQAIAEKAAEAAPIPLRGVRGVRGGFLRRR
jgi:hypothetical protein